MLDKLCRRNPGRTQPELGQASRLPRQPLWGVSLRGGRKSISPPPSFPRCPWPSPAVWSSCQRKGKLVSSDLGASVPESMVTAATLPKQAHGHLPGRIQLSKLPATYISERGKLITKPDGSPHVICRKKPQAPRGPQGSRLGGRQAGCGQEEAGKWVTGLGRWKQPLDWSQTHPPLCTLLKRKCHLWNAPTQGWQACSEQTGSFPQANPCVWVTRKGSYPASLHSKF